MSPELRHLLRESAPPPLEEVDLEAVWRRGRRQRAAGRVAAVLAVAAAVVVAVPLLSGGLFERSPQIVERPDGVAPPPLEGARWVTRGIDGLRTEDGRLIWTTGQASSVPSIARDADGGVVYVDDVGVWWLRADAVEPELVLADEHLSTVWEVIDGPDGPVARLGWDRYVSLDTGEEVAPLPGRFEEETFTWTAANGVTARIEDPRVDWHPEGGVERVHEPARLIVAQGGEVVVDRRVGGLADPFARIHDFDGRTIIVSRGPHEPALPEETFLVIDLSCADCIETFTASATTAALLAPDTDWAGPVVEPDAGSLSEPLLLTDLGVTDLPDGRHLGFLEEVGPGAVTFDLAVWFSGKDANHAAWEDGETDIPVPNDYYIRNLDPALLELPVATDVAVTSAWYHYEDGGLGPNRPITYAELLELFVERPDGVRGHLLTSPWWLTVRDGVVIALDEQYVP